MIIENLKTARAHHIMKILNLLKFHKIYIISIIIMIYKRFWKLFLKTSVKYCIDRVSCIFIIASRIREFYILIKKIFNILIFHFKFSKECKFVNHHDKFIAFKLIKLFIAQFM